MYLVEQSDQIFFFFFFITQLVVVVVGRGGEGKIDNKALKSFKKE